MITDSVNKRDLIEGLMKGLEVLNCFDAATPQTTASQVAQRLNISRAAARRFLITLAHTGYLESDGRYYKPTPKVLNLSNAYIGSSNLPKAVTPFLQRLTRELQFSSNCAVLEGLEAVYVARVNATRIMSTGFEPGTRLPAYTSSAGRVMLAALDDYYLNDWIERVRLFQFTEHTPTDKATLLMQLHAIRERQFEMTESLFEVGLRGIAVPLRNRNGDVLAAISVTMAASVCTSEEALKTCLPPLQKAAAELMGTL